MDKENLLGAFALMFCCVLIVVSIVFTIECDTKLAFGKFVVDLFFKRVCGG